MASGWTLAGIRQSGRHPAELPLAQAAVRRWETLGEELDADLEYRQEGNLRLARTPQEIEVIAKMVEEQQALGLELSLLPNNRAVRQVAPALSEAVLAASYCPTDGHANPGATVHALAAAAERAGARILTQTTVTGIEVTGGRVQGVETTVGPLAAGAVAVAAGVYSDQLCAAVGLDWPLSATHVSVVQTVPLPPLLKQVLGVANANFAGRQEVGGRLRMTTATGPWTWPEGDLEADDLQPPARSLGQIIERASLVLPAVAQAPVARVWGGLIAMTPDGLPVIERSPEIEGLAIAAGFSGHGFCLGPVTGQLICELVKGEEPSLPLGPFRRARFAGMTASARPELHG
jgi:sarcosine oxidase subunit beta